jgi:AhpD family alkylhydroperoxidase
MALIKNIQEPNNNTLKEIYDGFNGNPPEWVKVMANNSEILNNFLKLFNSIMKQGNIDPEFKWKIAHVVSQTLKCEFCLDVTKKMLVKLGLEGDLDASLTDKQKEILEIVKDLTRNGYLTNIEAMDKFCSSMSESDAVEIVSVIGLFNYINRFNNAFVILPE